MQRYSNDNLVFETAPFLQNLNSSTTRLKTDFNFAHGTDYYVIQLFGVSSKVLLPFFGRRIPCGLNEHFIFCHCKCCLFQVFLKRSRTAANNSFRIAQTWLELWLPGRSRKWDCLLKYLGCTYKSGQLQPPPPTSFFCLNSLSSHREFEKEASIHCDSINAKKLPVRGYFSWNIIILLSSRAFRHTEYAWFKELASFP